MQQLTTLQLFLVMILPVLFAITVHEVAHGWVALKFGDKTAQMMGRLTLNPINHMDPIGTVIVPTILYFLGGFIFGWAKPVPVNFENLRNPKRDMALVALAGPFANLVMAIFWGFIAKMGTFVLPSHKWPGLALIYMGIAGILINTVLMILNMIPIPPLDGSRVVSSLLPESINRYYMQLEPYGFFILIALIATGVLFKFMLIPIFIFVQVVMHAFQVPIAFLFSFLQTR